VNRIFVAAGHPRASDLVAVLTEKKIMHEIRVGTLAALGAALLVACGGGGDAGTPARGTVVSNDFRTQLPMASIDESTADSGLQGLSGTALCNVNVRSVMYVTRDPNGASATATTAVMSPSGADPACSGERPVLLYAHGTTTQKSYDMARLVETAAGEANGEGSLVMAMYAAQGFIVVAPNFLGYDRSSLSYHPYLNAEAQAVDMIDALRAAKRAFGGTSATRPSQQLVISGYSQGGHVAMATHKVIERDHASEFAVTASAPLSGPYNLVGFGDIVTGVGPVNGGATLFVPLLITSYQQSYGDIYTDASEVYQAPFDETMPTLFPVDKSREELVAEGLVPAGDPGFTLLYGPGGLLTDTFRAGYATSTYRAALERNTLLDWTPEAPMALCGGALDPTVFWDINATAAQGEFASRGATVPAWNLEDRASLPAGPAGDQIYSAFQAQKTDAGAGAQAAYHGALVPPFCTALARGYFQQILAAGS
jgi:hypothetical protein